MIFDDILKFDGVCIDCQSFLAGITVPKISNQETGTLWGPHFYVFLKHF